MKIRITKGEHKGKVGVLVSTTYKGSKATLTVEHENGTFSVATDEVERICDNCSFFEGTGIFGTCAFTHRSTESEATCRYHVFSHGVDPR